MVIHSTQPWPYPANLMMGAIGEALPDGEDILLKHDPELEDAQWVEVGQVRSALEGSTGTPDVEAEDAIKVCSLRGARRHGGLMLVVLLICRASYDFRRQLLSRINCFLRWSMAFTWRSLVTSYAKQHITYYDRAHLSTLRIKISYHLFTSALSVNHHKHSLALPI